MSSVQAFDLPQSFLFAIILCCNATPLKSNAGTGCATYGDKRLLAVKWSSGWFRCAILAHASMSSKHLQTNKIDCVKKMCQSGYAQDAKQAVALGQALVDRGDIYRVRNVFCFRLTPSTNFKNKKMFWRWRGSETWNLQPYERYA